MPKKTYFSELIAALRESLRHMEENKIRADDPAIVELKQAIRQILAEHDHDDDGSSPRVIKLCTAPYTGRIGEKSPFQVQLSSFRLLLPSV